MARVTILGGGRQGSVVASDLARDHEVTVVDVRQVTLPGVRSKVADLSDPNAILQSVQGSDLVVGALPARYGFNAVKTVIKAGIRMVDVSFSAEDVHTLDAAARAAGVAVLPDCGLAPGISNLLAGRAAMRKPKHLGLYVGGIAADPKRPYGYVISWAPSDLLDEYTRPARLRRNGKTQTLPVFSERERVNIPGVGELEAFLTDGCRTLLELDVPEIVEKTMRWPGHLEAIAPLLHDGTLVETLEAECREGDDLVALMVRADDQVVTMVARPRDGLSAMARTTALTCALFARWALDKRFVGTGVIPPEVLAENDDAYRFLLSGLHSHGIEFTPALPFLHKRGS